MPTDASASAAVVAAKQPSGAFCQSSNLRFGRRKMESEHPYREIWVAPMEGITLAVFRNTFQEYFPGADLYFTPFLAANHTRHFKEKEQRDIRPERNRQVRVRPQILTNKADELAWAVLELKQYGYSECDFNLGCSMPQVARKHKGAGMLADLGYLERFFDEFFSCPEIDESVSLSVKTRIGVEDSSSALQLIRVLNRFPFSSVTIHPRRLADLYEGKPDMEAFSLMYHESVHPVVYNGDIRTPEDYRRITEDFKDLKAVMIGRGLIRDPSLIRQIRGGQKADEEELWNFLHTLLQRYCEIYRDERQAVSKMKEIWWYMGQVYPGKEKTLKKIRKSSTLEQYEKYAAEIFT